MNTMEQTDTMGLFLKVIVAGVIIVAGGLIYMLTRKRKKIIFDEAVDLESVGLENIIEWFKNQADILQKNKNLKALLFKPGALLLESDSDSLNLLKLYDFGGQDEGKTILVQAIFDEEKGLIKTRKITATDISEDISVQFGDKPMIVFT
jgi:hypothetical protein